MTIIRMINGIETLIELTGIELMCAHEEFQKDCDIEDLQIYFDAQGLDVPKKSALEAVQKEYRKILDWNCGLDDAKEYAASTAIKNIIREA